MYAMGSVGLKIPVDKMCQMPDFILAVRCGNYNPAGRFGLFIGIMEMGYQDIVLI